jgi:HSP20 family protein
MAIANWNPFREMEDLLSRYATFAQDATRGDAREALASADWRPLVDIRENKDGYLIDIELPSVKKEDVNVAVKDGVLSVVGERKAEDVQQNGMRTHRIERRYGRFARSFVLPEDADSERIGATYRDGLLSLTIARREEVKPKSITIDVR